MNIDTLCQLLSSADTFKTVQTSSCLVGFDGFTDEIVRCVKERTGVNSAQFYNTIPEFAQKVHQAAGHSANFEFVPMRTKLGGNAPILASALVEMGCSVTLIGALGIPEIEEIFKPLTDRCQQVISLCPSGHTTAVEFTDGKLLFGRHASVLQIDVELLKKSIPEKKLIELFDALDLFSCANWTMILSMTDMWKYLLDEILPKINKKKRKAFFDLADPRKRTVDDLKNALICISKMQDYFEVTLGLNVSESEQSAHALGCTSFEDLTKRASTIQEKLQIEHVAIHALDCAATSTSFVKGPFCPEPLITTGGGDMFNAGFCLGLMLGLDEESCLVLATSTSGYYVRNGHPPTLTQLASFIESI